METAVANKMLKKKRKNLVTQTILYSLYPDMSKAVGRVSSLMQLRKDKKINQWIYDSCIVSIPKYHALVLVSTWSWASLDHRKLDYI